MGGISKALFGGSGSSSSNKAWGALANPLTSMATQGSNVFGNLVNSLGSFDDYKKNSGFDYQLNQGMRDTSGTNAARGLMNSGTNAKALATYESNLGNTTYGNWLDRLGTAAQIGTGAAGALTGAGSKSKSSSQTGILTSLFG